MPVRYLSEPELARLRSWPGEIADEDAELRREGHRPLRIPA